MSVIKKLWKFRGLFAFIIGIVVVMIIVTSVINKDKNTKAPEVANANMIMEKEPNNSSGKLQKTGKTLDKTTWYKLSGKFESNDDQDYYEFAVADGVNAYEIQTWQDLPEKNGKTEMSANSGLIINNFPLTIVCYDKAGKVLTNILVAGSGGGARLKEGTTRIVAGVFAKTPKEGFAPYASGHNYILYLKGTYKEPKAETEETK